MKPGKYSLSVYRGDTSRWRFTLWADTGKTEPADLAGASVAAEIRAAGSANSWNMPAGSLTCTIEAPNIIHVELAAGAALPQRGMRSEWDLQIIWPSGDVQTVLAGGVEILGDVTRAVA